MFIRKGVLVGCFVTLLITPRVNAEENFPFVATCDANKLHIRAGQNENFERVSKLSQGDFVVVVDKSYSWYKIKLPVNSQTYVHSDFVTPLRDGIGQISGNQVNIRARPKVGGSLLGQVDKGTMVRILENKDSWYRIEPVDQSFGWVLAKYLKYHSQDVPPARVVQLPTRNIYVKQREARALAEAEVQAPQKVSVTQPVKDVAKVVAAQKEVEALPSKNVPIYTGTIQDLGDRSISDDVRHKLVIDDKKEYLLQGYRRIIDSFTSQKVKIEGEIRPNVKTNKPVLLVTKIYLVL